MCVCVCVCVCNVCFFLIFCGDRPSVIYLLLLLLCGCAGKREKRRPCSRNLQRGPVKPGIKPRPCSTPPTMPDRVCPLTVMEKKRARLDRACMCCLPR